MQRIENEQIISRLKRDNPWWQTGQIQKFNRDYGPARVYLAGFMKLLQADVRRAVVLMGPRRVGKTVMLHHAIQRLLDQGVEARTILYVPIDIPTYLGLSLERLLELHREQFGLDPDARVYVLFDEIQYLKDWERHLKGLVDTYPYARFVVSGSAAAALRMKSIESGAGRFTDFLLPPLTFHEFLTSRFPKQGDATKLGIEKLNDAFVDYLNFGGFPEAVHNPTVQSAFEQFVASDILDKVLLNDIPSLYGVGNTHDLKRLFSVLAFNTGHEVSLEELSQDSGIAKNTLRKYIEYLEAAFLIHRLPRLDQSARRLKRETHFKVYLTNPCLRAALFGPVAADDTAMGALAETALMSQWAHIDVVDTIFYSRWNKGEVDFVSLHPGSQRPDWVVEVKWSNRAIREPKLELAGPLAFAKVNNLDELRVMTRSEGDLYTIEGIRIHFRPVAELTFHIGSAIRVWIESGESPRRWIDTLMQQISPSAD